MRLPILLSLLFLAGSAIADTPGEFVGKSVKGTTFVLDMDGASLERMPDSFGDIWKPQIYIYRGKKNYKNQLPSNCSLPRAGDAEWKVMDCEVVAATPLSGVKYKIVHPMKNGEIKLRCIEGCNSNVPTFFQYVPAEQGC